MPKATRVEVAAALGLSVPATPESHINKRGGTVRPWGCHDCHEMGDDYMVRNEVWASLWVEDPARPRRRKELLDEARTLTGLDLDELYHPIRQLISAHTAHLLCFACLEKRMGRPLRIPEDLQRRPDGTHLPINKPLLYGYSLGARQSADATEKDT